MSHTIRKGVATGDEVQNIFLCKRKSICATCSEYFLVPVHVNAVMETAARLNAPVIIQFSHGGAQFFAGKGLSNENEQSTIIVRFLVQGMYTAWLRLMEQL